MFMELSEAFAYQIENTRLLTEEDITAEYEGIVLWNGVPIRGDHFYYSSGRGMEAGDQLLTCFLVMNTVSPKSLLIERSEIPKYEAVYKVIRMVDNIPILSLRDQSQDQYVNSGNL